MASKMGIDPHECEFALRYLKNADAIPAYAEFHIRDLVTNRPSNALVNSVTVSSNPIKNLLTAYIEYFGVTRIVVHLSQTYTGPSVHETYAFDSVTGQAINLEVDLDLSDEEYTLSLTNETQQDGFMGKAIEYVMPIIRKFEHNRKINEALNDATKEAFEAMGIQPGGELPREKYSAFSEYLAKKVTSYLMS